MEGVVKDLCKHLLDGLIALLGDLYYANSTYLITGAISLEISTMLLYVCFKGVVSLNPSIVLAGDGEGLAPYYFFENLLWLGWGFSSVLPA